MADRTRRLRVEIVGDPRRIMSTFESIDRSAGRMAKGFSRATTLIGAGLVAMTGGAVVGAIRSMVDEAREAERVGKTTEARLKSTGGVANVTAGQIGKLAEALSNKLGIDDEIIQSGENMMLTFKGVRNEAGRNNDIFTQATRLAVDLAAGMHQGQVSAEGLQGANIQLGKALEDPIKGITALRRVGVSFTQAQRDQIKTLVESGKTLEAQKIILKAVGDQFAGSAEAAATPWQRFGVVIGNIKERIGNLLLPILDRAATFITDGLIPATESWVREHGPAFREAFSRLNQILGVVWHKLKDELWPEILRGAKYLAENLSPEVDKLTSAWRNNSKAITGLKGDLKPLTDNVFPILAHLVKGTAEEVRGLITMVGWLGRAWEKIRGPILTVVHALVREILAGFGQILHGAAAAFGWVPKVGGRLRNARDAFDQFQRDVNRQFDQIKDERVNITANFGWQGLKVFRTPGGALAMAEGGKITQGTGPTADDVLLWGSKGEAMVPERSASKPEFKAWAAAEGIPGFAAGGLIPVAHTPPAGQLAGRIDQFEGQIGRVLDLATSRFKALARKFGPNPAIGAFIRAADRLPYGWGAAGPSAFDCSGIVSAVLGMMLGMRNAGHGLRLFTTSTIHAGMYGLHSGLGGILQIGVTPGRGHMVGRYAGLGFEAESSRTGIKIGPAATRPESMARHYFHLASGGLIDQRMLDTFNRLGLDIGGDPGRLRINGRVFDAGGTLTPGLNVVANRTGRPEPLVPARQGGITIHFHGPVYGDRQALVREIRSGLKAALSREGKGALARQL